MQQVAGLAMGDVKGVGMLRSLGIGRWIGFALLAMVVIAIWRMNDGNLANIADGIWGLLNRGADVVQTLWENFIAAPNQDGGTSTTSKTG